MIEYPLRAWNYVIQQMSSIPLSFYATQIINPFLQRSQQIMIKWRRHSAKGKNEIKKNNKNPIPLTIFKIEVKHFLILAHFSKILNTI